MVYHCFTDVRIWASLGKAGITKIAYDLRRDCTTARAIVHLQTKDQLTSTIGIWASLGKAEITKIAYDFGRDRTTAQLCSCRHNATAVA